MADGLMPRKGIYLAALLVCSAPGFTSATPANKGADPEPRLADVCACARTDPELTVYLVMGSGPRTMELLAAAMLKCMLRVEGDPEEQLDAAARRGLEKLKRHADAYMAAKGAAERMAVERGELSEATRRRRQQPRSRVFGVVWQAQLSLSVAQTSLDDFEYFVEHHREELDKLEASREEMLDRASDVGEPAPIREEALGRAENYAGHIASARKNLKESEQMVAKRREELQAEAKELFVSACGR